jgi:hypothetical protein
MVTRQLQDSILKLLRATIFPTAGEKNQGERKLISCGCLLREPRLSGVGSGDDEELRRAASFCPSRLFNQSQLFLIDP